MLTIVQLRLKLDTYQIHFSMYREFMLSNKVLNEIEILVKGEKNLTPFAKFE